MSDANIILCPSCRQAVNPEFPFCPYCGKKLMESPLSMSVFSQAGIYLLSVLFPPLGLWPGVKYARSKNKKVRLVGWVAIWLTIISIIIFTWYSYSLIGQLTQSLGGIGNF